MSSMLSGGKPKFDGGGNMAKQKKGYVASIGGPTLVLIFIVMCLVTFGMLSLSTAKSEWDLAKRNASAVKEYYKADGEGVQFFQMVSETIDSVLNQTEDFEECRTLLSQKLGHFYIQEENKVITKISMDRSQALFIELIPQFEGRERAAISQWKVIQTEDLEIDNSMPVWAGEKMKEQENGK